MNPPLLHSMQIVPVHAGSHSSSTVNSHFPLIFVLVLQEIAHASHSFVGTLLGTSEGIWVSVGNVLGASDGACVLVGKVEGTSEGACVSVGKIEGASDGACVSVGKVDGASEGA